MLDEQEVSIPLTSSWSTKEKDPEAVLEFEWRSERFWTWKYSAVWAWAKNGSAVMARDERSEDRIVKEDGVEEGSRMLAEELLRKRVTLVVVRRIRNLNSV